MINNIFKNKIILYKNRNNSLQNPLYPSIEEIIDEIASLKRKLADKKESSIKDRLQISYKLSSLNEILKKGYMTYHTFYTALREEAEIEGELDIANGTGINRMYGYYPFKNTNNRYIAFLGTTNIARTLAIINFLKTAEKTKELKGLFPTYRGIHWRGKTPFIVLDKMNIRDRLTAYNVKTVLPPKIDKAISDLFTAENVKKMDDVKGLSLSHILEADYMFFVGNQKFVYGLPVRIEYFMEEVILGNIFNLSAISKKLLEDATYPKDTKTKADPLLLKLELGYISNEIRELSIKGSFLPDLHEVKHKIGRIFYLLNIIETIETIVEQEYIPKEEIVEMTRDLLSLLEKYTSTFNPNNFRNKANRLWNKTILMPDSPESIARHQSEYEKLLDKKSAVFKNLFRKGLITTAP